MKKSGIVLLAAVLVMTCCAPAWVSAEQPVQVAQAKKTPKKGGSTDSARVTHAEVARMLVNLLALARFLPANPSDQDVFALLLQNEIAPPGGWVVDAVVTKGDLAVVLVKSLKAMGEKIDIDPDDTKAAMAYLRQEGIPIDTIGEGLSVVAPLAQPVAAQVFEPTTDPLKKRERFSSTDEQESGADAERVTRGVEFADAAVQPTQEEVTFVVQSVSRPRPPTTRPTPFRPLGSFF